MVLSLVVYAFLRMGFASFLGRVRFFLRVVCASILSRVRFLGVQGVVLFLVVFAFFVCGCVCFFSS